LPYFTIALIFTTTLYLGLKLDGKLCFVNKGITKMARYKRKKQGKKVSKKAKKSLKDRERALECISHLLELNKLQGVLLTRLKKEV
jgi:hypothetical protein